MPDPRVAVILVNHNGQGDLPACLESLRNQAPAPRLLVVDNASTDGSDRWVEAEAPDVTLIRAGANLGFAAANNLGIRHLFAGGTELIWLVNTDTEARPGCLQALVAHLDAHPEVGAASPRIVHPDGERVWFAGGEIDFEGLRTRHLDTVEAFEALAPEARYLTGCALLVRRSTVEKVGLLDERFFMYAEDADFCLRTSLCEIGLAVVPGAELVHRVRSFPEAGEPQNPFTAYHLLRSEMLFWKKVCGGFGFHRHWCRAHLGKWVNDLPARLADPVQAPTAEAVTDAVWAGLFRGSRGRERASAPGWFRRLMASRPWLTAELLAFRLPPLRRRRTSTPAPEETPP